MADISIEVVVWHHVRRTKRPPYSASAFLVDTRQKVPGHLLESGNCDEADTVQGAARLALRALQDNLNGQYSALVLAALADPSHAITERRQVG